MNQSVVIGSRGSDLALWQANYIKRNLEALYPNTQFDIRIIRTTGDKLQDVALSKIGDKGLFTRQIENELLNGTIDLAVHSLKDLQTVQPDGLTIGAVCRREIPNDVLVSRTHSSIDDLPEGAAVATGSLRRRSQLLNLRPDLNITEIRGNVPTRLNKFMDSDLDGMILAYAGLHRLDLRGDISHLIPTSAMLPAVGQGAVAVEIRSDDERIGSLVRSLDHHDTRVCVSAERAFLKRLEGGCQVPIGALAEINGDDLLLEGVVSSLSGTTLFRQSISGGLDSSEILGRSLAEELIAKGADKLLDEARSDSIGSEIPVL